MGPVTYGDDRRNVNGFRQTEYWRATAGLVEATKQGAARRWTVLGWTKTRTSRQPAARDSQAHRVDRRLWCKLARALLADRELAAHREDLELEGDS